MAAWSWCGHMRCMLHKHTVRNAKVLLLQRNAHTHIKPHTAWVTPANTNPSWSSSPLQNLFRKQRCLTTNFGSGWLVCAAVPIRSNSSSTDPLIPPPPPVPTAADIGYIPDAPPIPEPVTDLVLNALGEPTLNSLGLCNMTPPGFIQAILETLHVSTGWPWWTAIVMTTVCLRILVFPLVILAQRNAAQMHNVMPTMTRLQEKVTKSRMSGNPMEAARAGNDLVEFMKVNKINPLKTMMVPLAQMPIFVSVFLGLRQMATLPVESLTTGGLLWFSDLTIPDPFFILPVLTMTTFFITIELGVDGMQPGNSSHAIKWVMRSMPLIMLPFIINFPTAMCCYWFTSNVVSLGQVLILKGPGVREYFNIPAKVEHEKSALPKKRKFVQGFKETMANSRMVAEVQDRQRMEDMRFREAGEGVIEKTYSYDPTKVKKNKSKNPRA